MKQKGEIKRDRIMIYYILAIVIPCFILGILAFRGIKNDQALLEREQRRILMETGRQIITDAYTSLRSVENAFAETTKIVTLPLSKIFTDSLLNLFSIKNKVVEGIFYFPRNGDFFLLNNGLLYSPDNIITYPDLSESQNLQINPEKGWQLEFRQKNYKEALKYYMNLLQQVKSKQAYAEILTIIARLQKKEKQYDEALQTWDQVWDKYTDILIRNRIPAGAVALTEKSLLLIEKMDTLSALKTSCLLLRQLNKPRWNLLLSDYETFKSKSFEIIAGYKNSGNLEINELIFQINNLKDSLSISENHT